MSPGQEQLFLVADPTEVKSRAAKVRTKSVVPAADRPIARVRVDLSVAHLDRDFDYLVPEELDSQAHIGSRVRVRFHGKLHDAIIVERIQESEFGKLQAIERIIGPALTADTLTLVNSVVQRYAGLFWDVVRSAVPTKHGRAARVGTSIPQTPQKGSSEAHSSSWGSYESGEKLMFDLAEGTLTRACWASAPATDWRKEIAKLISTQITAHPDKGVLVLLPDAKDVQQLSAECAEFNPTVMIAELGPEERYRSFLQIYSGSSKLVIGTRSAVFAPIDQLALIVMWDDGNDNFSEPHAPYWDAREVAALRSHQQQCSLLIGAQSRSVVTQAWCDSGWMRSVAPSAEARRAIQGHVRGMRPEDAERDPARARIPRVAWEAVKAVVHQGPVLIQVSRRGYVPTLTCVECGERAACQCGGAISLVRHGAAQQRLCTRCGSISWRCPCGGTELRALAIGAERTAEEIGRAFPGTPVLWSQSERIIAFVDDQPRIVVATPGAEPWAEGGFRAIIILDAVSSAVSLLAQESLIRRVFGAAVLASPGAQIIVVAPSDDRCVQSLTRWDSIWFAEREISERIEAHLPPATRVVRLDGNMTDIGAVLEVLQKSVANRELRVLGPVPHELDSKAHAFLLFPRAKGNELVQELAEITRVRSTDSKSGHVQVRVDPRDF